jgi:hypothetical protein
MYFVPAGYSAMLDSWPWLELQILTTQFGMLRNSGQHLRPDFYRIVKRPNVN